MRTDQPTTSDPVDVLVAARPTDESIHARWTATRSMATLARIERLANGDGSADGGSGADVRRRRRWALLGAAAMTAGAAIAATNVLAPQESLPQATAVERLAATAAAAPAPTLGRDQYIHVLLHATQQGGDEHTPAVDIVNESWADSAGRVWRRDVALKDPRGTGTRYYLFPTRCRPTSIFEAITPGDYHRWPTEPGALLAFIRQHIPANHPGDLDESQPIFENLSDRFVSGATPPALNAAMIRVLGDLPQVRTSYVRFADRDAVKVAYHGEVVQAMYFDRRTAQFLGATDPAGQVTMSTPEVVDEVPAEVVESAVRSGNEDAPAGTDCY